ncbi:hypothetical protein CYY_006670 [Polysphondylium violaceum]|uniref:Uncharacterized protein n=1 Tax=Polysphondylium violaceum TaxID=133409 RepID=A0A8J4PRJ7_9MYCE|nr:hypothetical protein CYY_006670 [Polysphondylium violaceum]
MNPHHHQAHHQGNSTSSDSSSSGEAPSFTSTHPSHLTTYHDENVVCTTSTGQLSETCVEYGHVHALGFVLQLDPTLQHAPPPKVSLHLLVLYSTTINTKIFSIHKLKPLSWLEITLNNQIQNQFGLMS